MSVALKIRLANGAVKTMRFTSEMSVSEACEQIFEKTNEGGFMKFTEITYLVFTLHTGGIDHGLFLPSVEGRTPAKWLVPEKTLQFYDLQSVCNDLCLLYYFELIMLVGFSFGISKKTQAAQS